MVVKGVHDKIKQLANKEAGQVIKTATMDDTHPMGQLITDKTLLINLSDPKLRSG